MAKVVIRDKKNSGFSYTSGKITVGNGLFPATQNELLVEAWKEAIEDKRVDPTRKSDYEYELALK